MNEQTIVYLEEAEVKESLLSRVNWEFLFVWLLLVPLSWAIPVWLVFKG